MLTEPKSTTETAPAAPHPATRPLPVPIVPGLELPPDSARYRLKNKLLGQPLHTEQLDDERLGKPTALAVFASDNLSSSAYATEEILRVLLPAIGVAAFALVLPVTIALLVVLGFLILSYRQTIKAYPTAGGAYMVTRDNFGLMPAQVAGVALLTDYVLTVAVSVSSGADALASAFGDNARQTGQGRDVNQFIQGQQKPGPFFLAIVGGVDQLFNEADHQGDGYGLVPTGRHDVQLMGPRQEGVHV